jgi:hypothetical protein
VHLSLRRAAPLLREGDLFLVRSLFDSYQVHSLADGRSALHQNIGELTEFRRVDLSAPCRAARPLLPRGPWYHQK